MPSSSPYISFPGTAAEAFAYYADVFGGDLDLLRDGVLFAVVVPGDGRTS
ncbi:hypothetical protein BRM3_04450 [Brachybacterium huguangmaarense]|uniref:VOC family protein n=1 Tax=Brachybacterium huguangmaarense TaxID=1652028 RepID=A0ABY6G392_9MICO|nr:hypothetical protein [Brachybacterium huguangmaarense]UYG17677.1 hypothetical protein BRM3_04450 [Brachybacterium huguangmaarense]